LITYLEAIIVVFYVGLAAVAYTNKYKNVDTLLLYFLVFGLCWLSSVQYLFFDPSDYLQYNIIFNNYSATLENFLSAPHEPSFNLLILAFRALNLDYESFIFVITLILFCGILAISNIFDKERVLIFISIITLITCFNLVFNLYRQAIAVSLVLIALIYRGSAYKKFAILVAAISFHISALAIVPYLALQNNRSSLILYVSVILSFILFFVKIDSVIIYIISYAGALSEPISYSSLTRVQMNVLNTSGVALAYRSFYILSLLLILLFAHKKRNLSRVVGGEMQWTLINYFTYVVVLYSVVYRVGSLSRLGIYAFIIIPPVLYIVLNMYFSKKDSKSILFSFSIVSLLGLFSVKNVYFV
jgi:hypothetical protein